jgi:hypothetical protein
MTSVMMVTRREAVAVAVPPGGYLRPPLFGYKYDPWIVAEFATALANATTTARFSHGLGKLDDTSHHDLEG